MSGLRRDVLEHLLERRGVLARAAAQGVGFTQPHVGHDSFRVLEASRCNGKADQKIAGTAESLEALPFSE